MIRRALLLVPIMLAACGTDASDSTSTPPPTKAAPADTVLRIDPASGDVRATILSVRIL